MEDYRFIQIQDEEEEEQIEENVTPDEIMVPVNLNDELENEEDSDYDDNDDDEDDYEDHDNDDDDEDYYIDDYEDEIDDYEREEVDEVIPVPVAMASPRFSNSLLLDSEGRNFDLNKSETDGLICPICFEAWTNSGDHQICCLPCGHLYGLSCIKKWLQKRRSFGKCPQCNNVSTLKDVRILYVNRLCVADEELNKRLRYLEAKCANLEQKVVAPLTADELINQICSNPTLLQRLATSLTELHQQQICSNPTLVQRLATSLTELHQQQVFLDGWVLRGQFYMYFVEHIMYMVAYIVWAVIVCVLRIGSVDLAI